MFGNFCSRFRPTSKIHSKPSPKHALKTLTVQCLRRHCITVNCSQLTMTIFWAAYVLNERWTVKHTLLLDVSSFHSCLSNFIVLTSFLRFVCHFTYPPSLSAHAERMAVQPSCFLFLAQLDFVIFHRRGFFSICMSTLTKTSLSLITWIL